jgi:N-acetylglutamate synthase
MIGTVEVERLASRGWRGTRTQTLGDWLLRAGSGFTGRANSVLPLGSAGCHLDEALDMVGAFYRRHDLTPLFQMPHCDETHWLDEDLTGRGWDSFNSSWVLVAELDAAIALCPPRQDLPPARFDDRPSDAWLGGYLYRGNPLPAGAVAVLTNADNVVFASLADDLGQAAVVRGVVTDGWLGVTALTVDQSRRRGGIGRHLMGELMRWAVAHGARQVYLQVAADNAAALGLYERLGFVCHHRYHYLRPTGYH